MKVLNRVNQLTKRGTKIIGLLFKIVLAIVVIAFIWMRVCSNDRLVYLIRLRNRYDRVDMVVALGILIVLMLLNWFVETLKWRFIVSRVEKISLMRAMESVYCGLSWAVFTPNRIGEFVGRVFFLSSRKRIQGIVAMAVGNVAQLLVTCSFGIVGFCWFAKVFLRLGDWLFGGCCCLGCSFFVLFSLFYFNIKWLNELLRRISFLKRYQSFFAVLVRYRKIDLFRIYGYSLFRYLIFTFQYALLLHWLIPHLPTVSSALMICVWFFVQTILPSFNLLDVGVRGVTAVYFFAYLTTHELEVLAVTAGIWFINLILPAFIGSMFIFKMKIFDGSR